MMLNRRKAMAIKALYTIPYSISYDLNGGTLSTPNPTSYTIETSQFNLNSPTREGYIFLGWTRNDDKTYVTSSPFGAYGDAKYTARWGMIVTEEDVSSNILNLTIDVAADEDNDGIPDHYSISFIGSSHIEKINIPLKNLVVGQKYKLTFTESNNATNGNSSGYWTAMYGFYLDNKKHTELSTVFKEEARAQGGLIAEWIGSADGRLSTIDGKPLNGPRDIAVDFTATSSTMYWVWDFGLIQDGAMYTYNLMDILVRPVVPKMNFAGLTLKDTDAYIADFTINRYGDWNMNFSFDGNSGAEFVYYPITGLTAGTTYTIALTHKFQGAFINGNGGQYEYGCGVLGDITSAVCASKMSGITTSWLSNTWTMNVLTNSTETIMLTFTATGSTAYWVWNMANVSDGTIATIDLNITNFRASHKNGGSIVYL